LGNFATNGHADASLTFVATLSFNNTTNTCTNACHLADAGDWDNDAPIVGGTLLCNDCHSQAGKSLNGGGESDLSATVGPNAGEHDIHVASNI
jgi:hypothetical protein